MIENADGAALVIDRGIHERNRAFIIAARTRWPAALDEVERLLAENERLRKEVASAAARAEDWYKRANMVLDRQLREARKALNNG